MGGDDMWSTAGLLCEHTTDSQAWRIQFVPVLKMQKAFVEIGVAGRERMWEGRGKERESNNGRGGGKSLLPNSTILPSHRRDREVQRGESGRTRQKQGGDDEGCDD
jgi:hypothetical protein